MRDRATLIGNFDTCNRTRLQSFTQGFNLQQTRTLQLLPLLFHTHVNLMPGYIGRHAPHGIQRYYADADSLKLAQHINQRFAYDDDEIRAQAVIEALFIQPCFISGDTFLWVIHQKHLPPEQQTQLTRKAAAICKWLASHDVHIQPVVCDAANISYRYYSLKQYDFHIDKCFFLDDFYAQGLLLAGKRPAWWLYEDDELILRDNSLLYCGDLKTPRANDYLSAAIWHLYNVWHQPLISWINLAIIDRFISQHKHRFYAVELRDRVHQSADLTQQAALNDYATYLAEIIDLRGTGIDFAAIADLLQTATQSPAGFKSNTTRMSVFSAYENDADTASTKSREPVSFGVYYQSIDKIIHQCEAFFRRIRTALGLTQPSDKRPSPLHVITQNLLARLRDDDDRINVLNSHGRFRMEQAHFHDANGEWTLQAGEHTATEDIQAGTDLLALVSWAFLNRLIDSTTSISVYCADRSIRQIDVMHILLALDQHIDLESLKNTDIEYYLNDPQPQKSILFIGQTSENYREQTINQLTVYNTGNIVVRRLAGLGVFSEWYKRHPQQTASACLYGAWSNNYRHLNREILSRIGAINIFQS